MQKTLSHDQVLMLLRKRQGSRSLRAYAKELGITVAYLSKVLRGEMGIGPKLLEAMQLEAVYRNRAA